MPKRGQQSPALAYGGRPKPGQPRRAQGRPVPRPHSSLAGAVPGASPADNARERPARSRATAAVFARSPFPVRAVARLDSPAPCPRRTGPFPPPRSARDGGRRPGPHGAGAGAARSLRTHRGRSRLRRCGRPRAVPGEQLSERAAGPRRGSRAVGRAERGSFTRWRRHGPRAPHLSVGPTQAVSVLSISCRIRSCSGRLSAILDGRDPAAAPLREAPREERPRSRAGAGGNRRGGFAGARWAWDGGEEGGAAAGEGAPVAPGRALRARTSSAVLRCPCQGQG